MDKDHKQKAQSGDITVIEQIINRLLKLKNVQAKVERYESNLYVYLDLSHSNFKKEKHQQSCVTLIKSIIEQMELSFIETITVYGEKQKNNVFSWKKEVQLKSKNKINKLEKKDEQQFPITKNNKNIENLDNLDKANKFLNTESKHIYQGGCHCGKIRFTVKINEFKATRCNCSICRKKGFLHLIVNPQDFKLLKGEEFIKLYTFHTHTAQHKFCSNCGIHPFYIPRSHPDMIDVNLNCLDQDLTNQLIIEEFDGQNWESNVHKIQ